MQHQRSRRPTRVTASQQCAIRIGQGPVRGNKVYFVLARGGVYTQGPMQQLNFQDPYLRASLGLIGLNDIEVITVEGNGPTLVVPGTHTLPHPEFDRAVHPKQTAVLGPAGSVALFFATVWHRGAANTTNQRRRALFCYYRAPDAIRVRRTPDPTAGTGWVLGDAGVLSAHWSE